MEKLKEIRKSKQISQKEFAAYMNVAQNTVSRWENGERAMDPDALTRAAGFFGVSVDYLLGNENVKISNRKISPMEKKIIAEFSKLNDFGKKEAIKRVSELCMIPQYVAGAAMPIAAHADKVDDNELELMRQDIDEL